MPFRNFFIKKPDTGTETLPPIAAPKAAVGGGPIVSGPAALRNSMRLKKKPRGMLPSLAAADERGSGYLRGGHSFRIRPPETFFEAAISGDNRTMAHLIKTVSFDVDLMDDHGRTALHWAAENGQDLACKFLIESGASMMLEDNLGRLALHSACRTGKHKVVALLLSKLSSEKVRWAVNAEDHDGFTPVYLARNCSGEGGEQCAQILIGVGAMYNDLRNGGKKHTAADNIFTEVQAKRLGHGWLKKAKQVTSGNAVFAPSFVIKRTKTLEGRKARRASSVL